MLFDRCLRKLDLLREKYEKDIRAVLREMSDLSTAAATTIKTRPKAKATHWTQTPKGKQRLAEIRAARAKGKP